jgi:hypothetical protein
LIGLGGALLLALGWTARVRANPAPAFARDARPMRAPKGT